MSIMCISVEFLLRTPLIPRLYLSLLAYNLVICGGG